MLGRRDIFFLYASLALLFTVICDDSGKEDVIGEAAAGEFPWQAILYKRNEERWEQFCSGFLINPKFVLSAAHCTSLVLPDEVRVKLGQLERDYYSNSSSSVLAYVTRILIPRAYPGKDRNMAMDISLLELEEKVPISDNVKPAHVDWDNTLNLENGRILTSPIWKTEDDPSPILHWTKMRYIETRECLQTMAKPYSKFLSNDKSCAVGVNGTTVYMLNSGGGAALVQGSRQYVIAMFTGVLRPAPNQKLPVFLMTNITNLEHRAWLMSELGGLDSSSA